MDIKEYRHSTMSLSESDQRSILQKVGDFWQWSSVKNILILALVGMVAVVAGYRNGTTTANNLVKSFSYHAYENNNAAIHSPFLGKVRLASSNVPVEQSEKLTDNMKQSICENRTQSELTVQKCKMMRTPTLHLGMIHSSWSVLGAQSIYILVKNIAFIFGTFILFSWVEEQIRTEGYFRNNFSYVRTIVVVIAIVALTINVCMDITGNMHEVDTDHENVQAIGSISTGFYFCLISVIIICFSHLDDPYNEVTPAKPEAVKSSDSDKTVQVAGSVENGEVVGLGAKVNFYYTSTLPTETKNDANKRLYEIYGMLHTSHLLLVIFPLVLILALAKTKNVIVDVHVQLIFFSSIFLAVLEIIQTRVLSVLAFSKDNGYDAIRYIKIFVSLALLLAKAFVYVPSLQIIFMYTTGGTPEFWLVVCVSLLFLFNHLLEIVYLVGGLSGWTDPEAWLVSIRKVFFFIYGISLVVCLWIQT
jgi:hypothetical protein